jgi:hypothetical protein
MSINSMAQYNGGTSWTRYSTYFLAENSYNTTGVSLGIANVGGQGATLISNRHVLLAKHVDALFTYPQTLYFVNNSNTVFTYTINSAADVAAIGPSSGTGYTDISIGYLNTTIDASLSFHKVIPSDFLSYIQNGSIYNGLQFEAPYLPVFYMDGGDDASTNKRTWCGNLQYVCGTSGGCTSDVLYYCRPRSGNRYTNSQALQGGDSGNIIFIPLNNEIVILGTWYQLISGFGNPGDPLGISSFISPNISAINAAMTSLAGTSYSVTQADLSGFKIYN